MTRKALRGELGAGGLAGWRAGGGASELGVFVSAGERYYSGALEAQYRR